LFITLRKLLRLIPSFVLDMRTKLSFALHVAIVAPCSYIMRLLRYCLLVFNSSLTAFIQCVVSYEYFRPFLSSCAIYVVHSVLQLPLLGIKIFVEF